MIAPPDLPVASLSGASRFLRGTASAFLLGTAVGMLWTFIAMIAAGSMDTASGSESVGLPGMVIAPVAGLVAFVTGAVIGAIARKGALRWRLLWTLLIFAILGASFSGLIVYEATKDSPSPTKVEVVE